jgi:tape measure domain-containing protein
MATADEVIVEFKAQVGKYEADLRRSAAIFERVTQAQQRQMVALERQIALSSGKIGSAFRTLAGLFGAQQVISLSDSYTRLQNSLRVAGLEGEALADVQAKLLDLGGKYGVSVNTLADLYGNLSQVSGELGATQQQVLRINEAVAQSLIVTGKSSQEASGAVLGLVQAFGNGKLQAEEWAQINEGGLRPLLEAAAASEKYGGSVQKLRKAVYDGKVSSQEFFQAILTGADVVGQKAATATLTLEGAYTSLNNRLIEFVGSAASSSGAAGALASGLQGLGSNLDTVSSALAVIASVMGVRFVAAAGSSVVASTALAAANVRAALTAEALSSATYQANAALLGEASAARLATASVSGLAVAQGVAARAGGILLGAVGGPVGVAVLALAAGIAYLALKTDDAANASGQYAKAQQVLAKIQDKSAAAALAVATATGKARVEALANAKALQQETQQYIANAKAAVAAARAKASQAAQDARAVAASSGAQSVSTGSGMILGGNIVGQRTDTANRQAQTNLRAAEQNLKKAEDEIKRINATIDGLSAPRIVAPTADDPKKKTGSKSKPDGPDATAAERELSRLRVEELQARLDLAITAEARADLQRQILAGERAQRVAEIKADKDLTDTQRKAALAAIDRLYGAKGAEDDIVVAPGRYSQRIGRDLDAELAQEAQDAADERFRADQEILRNQYDLADSSAERKRLAIASIDLEERYQRAQLQAIIDLEGANSAAGKRAQIGLDTLGEINDGRRAVAGRSNQSPLEAYRGRLDRDPGETRDMVEGYVVDELESVRDSIRSGIEKQLGIKDPLISGLLNMLIEDVLIKPITEALSQASGSGGGMGGLFKSIGTAVGSFFGGGRAIGGPVRAGTPYEVGENGREVFVPQQAGVIVPNHALRGGNSAPTVINAPQFNLAGAVITRELYADMERISNQSAARAGAASYQQAMKDAPGSVRRAQRFRTR